ncbi:WD40/YVTN/BNR-like repeat-containing protein [Candidatus Margulisiibacteriota bacterium]
MNKVLCLLISLLIILLSGCTNPTAGINDTNGDTTDYGNDPGNGYEIISGPSGPSGADIDNPFRSLTVHPTDPDTIIMGTERNGFVKSTDGGSTWDRYRYGLRHTDDGYPEIWDIAISSSNPSIILAATLDSPGPVTGNYPSSIAGVYKSTDGGQTWARKNRGLTSSRITSVRFHPSNPDTAVIGVEGGEPTFVQLAGHYYGGGIYKTADGGETWSRITLGTNDDRNGFWHMKVRDTNPASYFTFAMNYYNRNESIGFLKSLDFGTSWSGFGTSLKTLLIDHFDISNDGQIIYTNQRDTYKLHKSTDGGNTWATTSINQANGPVAISPADQNIVIYCGSTKIYRSVDGLLSFTLILSADNSFTEVVFAPSNPDIVYAVTTGYILYKSTDGGASFSLIKNIRTEVLNVIS